MLVGRGSPAKRNPLMSSTSGSRSSPSPPTLAGMTLDDDPTRIRNGAKSPANLTFDLGHRLTADYRPWRPDRRFSTPVGCRAFRSPSPRLPPTVEDLDLDSGQRSTGRNFRHRAASLPASDLSPGVRRERVSQKRKERSGEQWPQPRSPNRVEQRFLQLSESADYDKLRSFVLDANGDLVERGYCYRHRSETGSTSSAASTGASVSPSEDAIQAAEPVVTAERNYTILVIGAPNVGKTCVRELMERSEQFRTPEFTSPDDDEQTKTVLSVLVCGKEVALEILEYNALESDLWSSVICNAAIVFYSITDKRSFSAAADALYQIRACDDDSSLPVVLVANKIDLERQRQVLEEDGAELAKSYDCRFLEVSALLEHRVEDLLALVMNEIFQQTTGLVRQEPQKQRRFSLRKQPKSPRINAGRARSLYTLPGLPAHRNGKVYEFLTRLFGRKAARSCEDIFRCLSKR